MEQLSESVSALKRAARVVTAALPRKTAAVLALPGECDDILAAQVIEQVAATAAQKLHRALGECTRRDDVAHHRSGDIGSRVAGLTIVGTPASTAGASFSSMPQTGKLNALICNATPCGDV